jgi:hypothetical protein
LIALLHMKEKILAQPDHHPLLRFAACLFAGGILATMLAFSTNAEPPSGMDRPAGDVRNMLARVLGRAECGRDERNGGCQVEAIAGSLSVYRDPANGTVGTVWLNALVVAHPRRRPGTETRSRNTAVAIVLAVLPEWKNGAKWLTRAIADARRAGGRHVTKVGPINVLVQNLQPADLADTYAEIILTKRAVDDWLYREDVGSIETLPCGGPG